LNEYWFVNIIDAQEKIALWREKPTIRNDLTVPCRISLPMNLSKNIKRFYRTKDSTPIWAHTLG